MSRAADYGIRAEAEPLYLALQLSIRDRNDDGRRTPCQTDPDPFTSDDREDRAEAAEACRRGCPVLELCGRYADAQGERWGVLGGVDRTPNPRKKEAAA